MDLIKILACIAVVGLHTLSKDLSILNSVLYSACGFAVPAFFASSGYTLLNRGEVQYSYSLKKILLILKVVFFWCFVFVCLESAYYVVTGRLYSNLIIVYLVTIGKGLIQKGAMWHFWYFGSLIILYLCLPLLTKIRDKLKYAWGVLLIVSCLLQFISYFIGTPIQGFIIQTFRGWSWLQYFILGGLIGGHLNKFQGSEECRLSRINPVHVIVTTVLTVVYQNVVGRLLLHNTYAEFFYDSIFMIVWVFILFCYCIRLHLSDKVKCFVKLYAPITMGVYILHPILLRGVKRFIVANSLLSSIQLFLSVLAISSIAAFVVSKIPIIKEYIKL